MLLEQQKQALIQSIESGEATQEEAALVYGVTRWYVRKLMIQHKANKQAVVLSPQDLRLLEVARATGLDADQLKQALALPPLTDRNIFLWLTQQTPERMARLLFQAVLTQQARQQEPQHAPTQAS